MDWTPEIKVATDAAIAKYYLARPDGPDLLTTIIDTIEPFIRADERQSLVVKTREYAGSECHDLLTKLSKEIVPWKGTK